MLQKQILMMATDPEIGMTAIPQLLRAQMVSENQTKLYMGSNINFLLAIPTVFDRHPATTGLV